MTQPPSPSRGQRLALAIVPRLPVLLVRDTERVVLNLATGTVGFTSLLALREPGTIATVLPFPLLVLWSVTLMIGAAMVLLGMSRGYRILERAGLMLSAIGCVTYAAALFSVGGARAQIIGVLFLAIAAANLLRLLASSASNATVTTTADPS